MFIWLKRLMLMLSVFSMFIVTACGSSFEKPLSKDEASVALAEEEEELEVDRFTASDVECNYSEQLLKDNIQFEIFSRQKDNDLEQEIVKNDPVVPANENDHFNEQKVRESKTEESTKFHSNQTAKKESARVEDQQKESQGNKKSDSETNKVEDSNKTANVNKETSEPKLKDKEPDPEVETESEQKTVVYSIVISDEEIPLTPTEIEIEEGDTVLDTLIKITMENKIQMDYRGGQGATAYVEGIDNVYEFDRGQGSGWMYRVNGIFPDRGAGVIPLLPGDRVEWLYTTDLGKDLGADLKSFRR